MLLCIYIVISHSPRIYKTILILLLMTCDDCLLHSRDHQDGPKSPDSAHPFDYSRQISVQVNT